MIDFHTHILPAIDDGAKTEQQTFELIQEAKQAGFDEIILTPHYMEDYYEIDESARKNLLQKLVKMNLPVKLYLANEIYFSKNIVNLIKSGKASRIHHTPYVLFELPMNSQPLNLYDVIYEIQRAELIPILAHPERYTFMQSNPDLIYDLVQRGVLMQQNYGSIVGQFGKKAQKLAKNMLNHDLVHFLGSDVHRPNSIYKQIPKILPKLEKIVGKQKLYQLTTQNPSLVLAGKQFQIKNPSPIKLSLKEKWKICRKK